MGDYLYVFGGFAEVLEEDEEGQLLGFGPEVSGDLHRLDLRSLSWERLHPAGTPPLPTDKLSSWVHGGKLYLFGGYGAENAGLVQEKGEECRGTEFLRDESGTKEGERESIFRSALHPSWDI